MSSSFFSISSEVRVYFELGLELFNSITTFLEEKRKTEFRTYRAGLRWRFIANSSSRMVENRKVNPEEKISNGRTMTSDEKEDAKV